MQRGYVKVWRKIVDSGLIQNAASLQLAMWCLIKASHKKRKQIVGTQTIELYPGQLVFGRKAAAMELQTTEQRIRTTLKTLKNMDFLTIKPTNKFSIISIINWDTYQSEQPAANQQVNQPSTSNQPAPNHKQECKKEITKTKTSEETPDQPFSDESMEIKLATYLYRHIQKRKPDFKEPNLQTWAKHVDLMLRLDKRNPETVKRVIEFCHADQFEQNNVLSTAKLRKRFDHLEMKATPQTQQQQQGGDYEAILNAGKVLN